MTGLTHRTLRYYEELGLLGKRHHRHGRARVYTESDVERLRFIIQLQQFPGFNLQQIKAIVNKRGQIEQLLEEARSEADAAKRREKLLKAREEMQAHLDLVEKKLEKLVEVRKRMRAGIAKIDRELEE